MTDSPEARARLVGALMLTRANAGDLSVLLGRDRRYLSRYLSGDGTLDPEAARTLEIMLALGLGALREPTKR